jgi:hypothetical protein
MENMVRRVGPTTWSWATAINIQHTVGNLPRSSIDRVHHPRADPDQGEIRPDGPAAPVGYVVGSCRSASPASCSSPPPSWIRNSKPPEASAAARDGHPRSAVHDVHQLQLIRRIVDIEV